MKELEGQLRWDKYPRKCRKQVVVWECIEKRRRIRREEGDGDGGAGEKKERKTEVEVTSIVVTKECDK